MTSQARTVLGTNMYVCASAPATHDAAGFAALTWTKIGEVTDGGTYGEKHNAVKHNPIDSGQTVKLKGSYDAGTQNIKVAQARADAGQAILITARSSYLPISFKIVHQDGLIDYYSGLVMSYVTTLGTVDSVLNAAIDIEVTDDIIYGS